MNLLALAFHMITKDAENLGGRGTSLELGHQRMGEKVLLRLLLILFEGSIKDGL
jgi:hypothetical protein